MPLEGELSVDDIHREDAPPGAEFAPANFRFISTNYFAAVGTPVIHGRAISMNDRGRRVVVLSERAASTLWPDKNAVGQRVVTGGRGVAEVIGVAADVRTNSLESAGSLVVYLPTWEGAPAQGVIVVRTEDAPSAASIAAVRAALRDVDVTIPVSKTRTMAQVLSGTIAERRFQVALLLLFAGLALVTASVGIYGTIAQSMASRTREIGLRMALGARQSNVVALVLREGLTPVAVGLLLGIGASLVIGQTIAGLLFQVTPTDPVTIATVTVLLGIVGTLSCMIPAIRAAHTDLATMLRED